MSLTLKRNFRILQCEINDITQTVDTYVTSTDKLSMWVALVCVDVEKHEIKVDYISMGNTLIFLLPVNFYSPSLFPIKPHCHAICLYLLLWHIVKSWEIHISQQQAFMNNPAVTQSILMLAHSVV